MFGSSPLLSRPTRQGFTLSDFVANPLSQVSSFLPPGRCFHFYGAYLVRFCIPTAHRFSSNLATSRSGAFRSSPFLQEIVPTILHSVRLEPTKLILIGTRTTYQAAGDAGTYLSFASLILVVSASCKPFMGNDPRQLSGMCCTFCQTVPEDVAIVGMCMVVFGSIDFVFTVCPRVVTLTAPQTAGVFLSVFTTTVRFVRCRQHSRQQHCSQ